MGNKKNKEKNAFPAMPGWDWDSEEQKAKWEEFKANAEKLWDQYEDMQKAAKKAWKQQWETFFAQLMGMEQTVADALPDEKVSVPGMPAAPCPRKKSWKRRRNSRRRPTPRSWSRPTMRLSAGCSGSSR